MIELASLQNQVKYLRLQGKLGNWSFHEDLKKVFEAFADTVEDISKNITETMMVTYKRAAKQLQASLKCFRFFASQRYTNEAPYLSSLKLVYFNMKTPANLN